MPIQSAERRREQNRAEARRVILDATEAILLEEGYGGFSVRKLVGRCGYSAPTLYHYFGDKPGLLDALIEERLGHLVEDLKQVPVDRDPVENLRALSRAFAHFGFNNPTHYQLLMQPRQSDEPPSPKGEEARSILGGPLDQLAEAGRIALGDVEAVRQTIWAALHGLISLKTSRPDVEWCPDLLELSLEGIIRGWLEADAPATQSEPTLIAADGIKPKPNEENE